MNIGDCVETCQHRVWAIGGWAVNDGFVAPVLFLDAQGPCFVTLTNETVYVKCPDCYLSLLGAVSKLKSEPSTSRS